MSSSTSDPELKARHRAMWASGDYPSMVETFLAPLGSRCDDWNRGTPDQARFEMEYLLAVGTRA